MRRSYPPPTALLLLLAFAPSIEAQVVRGQVADSATHAPLTGAAVALLNADGEEVSRAAADDDGLFTLRAPAAGEYQLQVDHAGYGTSLFPPFTLAADEVKGFLLQVASQDTGEPEAPEAGLVERLCAAGAVTARDGVVFGMVRDGTTGEPVAGVEVNISWPTVSGPVQQLIQGNPLDEFVAVVPTGENGYYVACGVPRSTLLILNAGRGDLLSDFAEVRFDSSGVWAAGEHHVSDEPVWRQDFELLLIERWAGTINGVVIDKAQSSAVAGAVVRIARTPLETTTRHDGSFTITGVPRGPIRLTVQHAGFRPLLHEVTLQPGESVTLPEDLLSLQAIAPELPAAFVTAERGAAGDPKLAGFRARRERGSGSFITRDEFEDSRPQLVTEVLRRMSGVWVHNNPDYASTGKRWLVSMSRGGPQTFMNPERRCPLLYFVDGMHLGDAETIDIDEAVPVSEVQAIEAYNTVSAIPAEFNRVGSQCGVIAVWMP